LQIAADAGALKQPASNPFAARDPAPKTASKSVFLMGSLLSTSTRISRPEVETALTS